MNRFSNLSIELQIIITMIFLVNIIVLSSILHIKFSRGKNLKSCIFDFIICGLNILLHVGYQYIYRIEFEYDANLGIFELLDKIPIVFIYIFMVIMLIYIICDIVMERQNHKNKPDVYSIKETLDNLDVGICFSELNGQLVLTNKKMLEIVGDMTGLVLTNSKVFWEELTKNALKKEVKRISKEEYVYKLSNNSIWKFEKTKLNIGRKTYVQIICNNITYIHDLTTKLKISNYKLDKKQERLRKLLTNIAVTSQEEEVLMSKIRVHDSLGRSILSTRRFLVQERDISESKQIVDMWKNTINRLDASVTSVENKTYNTKKQIIDIASMLGCRVMFEGDFPKDKSIQYLMLSIVREAVTNSVRHVKAKSVFVILNESKKKYCMTIFDDNNKEVEVKEGGGLSNLRRKVENIGGSLEIDGQNGIKIKAVFLKGENYV